MTVLMQTSLKPPDDTIACGEHINASRLQDRGLYYELWEATMDPYCVDEYIFWNGLRDPNEDYALTSDTSRRLD